MPSATHRVSRTFWTTADPVVCSLAGAGISSARMAAMLILEGTGPRAEELAMKAGDATDIPVGWDSEFESATFDSDDLDEAELQRVVFEALDGIDPDWRSHLRVAD